MDKVTCATNLYSFMVHDVIARHAESVVHMSDNDAAEAVEMFLADTPTFHVDEDALDFLKDEGMSEELMRGFGFLIETDDGRALDVPAIRTTLKSSPRSGPGPAPL